MPTLKVSSKRTKEDIKPLLPPPNKTSYILGLYFANGWNVFGVFLQKKIHLRVNVDLESLISTSLPAILLHESWLVMDTTNTTQPGFLAPAKRFRAPEPVYPQA
jgi:hypothetical protein